MPEDAAGLRVGSQTSKESLRSGEDTVAQCSTRVHKLFQRANIASLPLLASEAEGAGPCDAGLLALRCVRA